MKALSCAALGLFAAFAMSPAFAVDPGSFSGEWRQVSLGGIGSLPSTPQCAFYGRTERTLRLVPVPAHPSELRGTWRRDTVLMWTPPSTADCRWSNESQYVPFAEANLTMVLDAQLDRVTGTLAVTTHFDDCQGPLCARSVPDAMRSDKLPSTFKLRLSDGELFDDDMAGGEHRIFLRTAAVADKIAGAQDRLAQMQQLLAARRADELMSQFASAGFAVSGAFVKPMLQTVDPESKREQISQLYGTWNAIDPQHRGEYIFVLNKVTDPRNRFHFEYMVWKREENAWRLDYLMET